MSAARPGSQIDLGAAVENELAQDDGQRQPEPRPAPERTRPGRRRHLQAAEEIVSPRPEEVARKPLNVNVPAALDLHNRMRRYQMEQRLDMRDQAALAIDVWLRERGY
jgi:hypothetical protein